MDLVNNGFSMGIVTSNGQGMLGFYGDTLGFESTGSVNFPDMGTVYKLAHGSCQVKILVLDRDPQAANPGGGFSAATGFRYCSFQVAGLEELVARCSAAGCEVAVAPGLIRPGVKAAVIADPDGNTIEFMEFEVAQ